MLYTDSDYPFIFKLFLYNYICVCKLISLKKKIKIVSLSTCMICIYGLFREKNHYRLVFKIVNSLPSIKIPRYGTLHSVSTIRTSDADWRIGLWLTLICTAVFHHSTNIAFKQTVFVNQVLTLKVSAQRKKAGSNLLAS
jgi:hypothetical protein